MLTIARQTFHTLLNEGDACLVESPAYSGVLPELEAIGANLVPVPSDSEGMKASSLREILSSWTTSEATKSFGFPKFVYTTPTGANPSGTTASEQRKREVLQVIREYGILLLEDDPYLLLSFQGLEDGPAESRKRPKTYWDLEQEGAEEWGTGWIMRFDSFSKVRLPRFVIKDRLAHLATSYYRSCLLVFEWVSQLGHRSS